VAGGLGAAVLVAAVLYAPLAQAADDDPAPPDFPSVQKPTDKSGGQPDPGPTEWPRVAQSGIDGVGDPLPISWPAPLKG
jgi:hypothetical protein